MVSRYRGESASPLHLGGKNLTRTEIELSMINRSMPLIPNPLGLFLGNGSHPPFRFGPSGDCAQRFAKRLAQEEESKGKSPYSGAPFCEGLLSAMIALSRDTCLCFMEDKHVSRLNLYKPS